ncbi:unnamed protein product [Caenorhabditis nigoni]
MLSSRCLFLPILLLLIPNDVTSCDITATLTSQSYFPVYAVFTFHDGRTSVLYLPSYGSSQSTRITGSFCNSRPTRLDAYRSYPGYGAYPYASTQAFLEGFGFVNYSILSDSVSMGAKAGVMCAAGDCGRG